MAFQISTISILQTYLEDSLKTLAFTKDSPNKQASQVRACRDFIVSVSCLSLVGFDSTWRLKLPRRMKLPINSTRPGARSCHLFSNRRTKLPTNSNRPGVRSCQRIQRGAQCCHLFRPGTQSWQQIRISQPASQPAIRLTCHIAASNWSASKIWFLLP